MDSATDTRRPPDTTPIWRLPVEFLTADVRHGETDDTVAVKFNHQSTTYVDYPRDDFERGDDYRYDMVTDGIRSLEDIQEIRLSKEGSDGWCEAGLRLFINSTLAFSRDYSPCVWIGYADGYVELPIPYVELRRDSTWQQWRSPRLLPPVTIGHDDLQRMLAASIGTHVVSGQVEWGKAPGVELAGTSSTVLVTVHLRHPAVTVGDMDVAVSFDLEVGCSYSVMSIVPTNAACTWIPHGMRTCLPAA